MAPANRLPVSDVRKFATAGLVVLGVFLLFCGTGMSNVVVGGAGVLIALGGPALIMLSSTRSNARRYMYGTAHVHGVSPLPATGSHGRCELQLVVNAQGIDHVPVRVRDPAAPVNKWPDVGATLPVQIVAGRTRKVTILWDKVRTHREAANDDRMYPGYANLSDEERIHRPSDEEVYIDHGPLPPDDRPTVTDLPPVVVSVSPEAGGDEPAEPKRGGEQVLVMERPPPPSTAAQRPDNASGRRRPSPRPRRTLHTEPLDTEPVHAEPVHVEPVHVEPVHAESVTPALAGRPGEPGGALVGGVAEPSAYAIPEGGAVVAPDEARPGEARPGEARPGEARPGEARPGEMALAPPREIEAPDVEPLAVATPEVTEPDPADELEPEPPRDGGIAQFLATTPQHRSVPLTGVNGVSVTLDVSDLQRSRRFYRDTLGLTELDSSPGSAVLASGDARLVLRRVADMPPVDRRVVHLNLDVPDVYEAYERLRAEGVEFVHRPRVVPQGEHLELCSAKLRDPDGHAIALTRWELRR